MNERIKELYLQAHGTRHYDGDPALDGNPPTVYWQGEASAQRFAGLIIQKCISQIALIGISNYENDDVMWATGKSIENIREHFGMKDETN